LHHRLLGAHSIALPPLPGHRGYAGETVELAHHLDGLLRVYRGDQLLLALPLPLQEHPERRPAAGWAGSRRKHFRVFWNFDVFVAGEAAHPLPLPGKVFPRPSFVPVSLAQHNVAERTAQNDDRDFDDSYFHFWSLESRILAQVSSQKCRYLAYGRFSQAALLATVGEEIQQQFAFLRH